ncbi:Placenta growth factor [Anas platyrhynchos]|uniref:Placenta growth factor n=1 Tax=Anas platyrhynchos TaxID=8839 RepID=R0K5S3_ANAPL|nr:Placenta growth factor [Anas platyrhynchos]
MQTAGGSEFKGRAAQEEAREVREVTGCHVGKQARARDEGAWGRDGQEMLAPASQPVCRPCPRSEGTQQAGSAGEEAIRGARRVVSFKEIWNRSFCRPLEQLVDVIAEFPDEVEYIFRPSCVALQRCGGCCGDEGLRCVPVETSTVTMQSDFLAAVTFPDCPCGAGVALVLVILPALGTKTQKSQWKGKTGSVIALVCQEMVVVVLAASVRWGEACCTAPALTLLASTCCCCAGLLKIKPNGEAPYVEMSFTEHKKCECRPRQDPVRPGRRRPKGRGKRRGEKKRRKDCELCGMPRSRTKGPLKEDEELELHHGAWRAMRNGAGGCAAGGGMGWGLQPRNCSVLPGRGRRDSRDRQGCIAPSLARSSPGGARVGGELAWGGLQGGTGRELGCCGPSCAGILFVASPFSIKAGGRPRSWQGECSSPFQQLQAALVTWGPGTRSGEGAAPL